MKNLIKLISGIVLTLGISIAHAGTVTTDVPDNINPAEKYMIYMHGISVELYGPDSYSDIFNRTYENTKIAKTLAEHGFNVIAEVREEGDRSLPKNYAQVVDEQAYKLLKAGVPAKNISVVGHSRGAYTALIASTYIANPEINYAILAGCALESTDDIAGFNVRKFYMIFVNNRAELLNGRYLSLRDKSDEWFGSCNEAFSQADGIETKEIVLQTGEGHGVFYSPNPAWIDLVVKWANGEKL